MVRSRCTPYSRGRPRLGRWHTFPRAGWCLRPSVCSVEWAVMVVNVAMGGCVVLCSSGTETESNVLPCAPPITSRGVCWREHVVGTSRWAAFVVFLDCNCFVSAVVRRLSPGLQEDLYGAEPYALNLLPAGGRHWGGGGTDSAHHQGSRKWAPFAPFFAVASQGPRLLDCSVTRWSALLYMFCNRTATNKYNPAQMMA